MYGYVGITLMFIVVYTEFVQCGGCDVKNKGCGEIQVTDGRNQDSTEPFISSSSEPRPKNTDVSSTSLIVVLTACLVAAIIIGGVAGGYCKYCRSKADTADVGGPIFMDSPVYFHCGQIHVLPEIHVPSDLPPPYAELVGLYSAHNQTTDRPQSTSFKGNTPTF